MRGNTSSPERARLGFQTIFYRSPGYRITCLRPVLHQECISMSPVGHDAKLSKVSPNLPYTLGRDPYFMEMNNSLALKVLSAVARLEKRAERSQMVEAHTYLKF